MTQSPFNQVGLLCTAQSIIAIV